MATGDFPIYGTTWTDSEGWVTPLSGRRRRIIIIEEEDCPPKFWPTNLPPPNTQPCLHKSCMDCFGTGRKRNGELCIHMISCPCPRCSPHCTIQAR